LAHNAKAIPSKLNTISNETSSSSDAGTLALALKLTPIGENNMRKKSAPPTGAKRKLKTLPLEFETFEDAKAKRIQLIRRLAKSATPVSNALANELAACRKQSRCGSGACPVCNRAFRLRLASEVQRVRPDAFEVIRISLIPASFRVEVYDLPAFDLLRWVSSRRRAFQRALPKEALFVGGVDISLNTFENGDPHWCFHLYGFVLLPKGWGVQNRSKMRRMRAELERRCPPVPKHRRIGAERVLTVGALDSENFDGAFLYAHKGGFYRRSRYAYTREKTGKRSTNAEPQAIPRLAALELSIFLARYRLGSRLILIGFRRHGSRFDRFTLCRERDFQSSQNDG